MENFSRSALSLVVAIIFCTPAFTQNDQPPEWVASGRFLKYSLGKTEGGASAYLIVQPPCQLASNTLDIQGNQGEFVASVMVNPCSPKAQAKEMQVTKIVVGSAPSAGLLDLDSLPPLSVVVDAFVVAEDSTGTLKPQWRQEGFALPAYYYMAGSDQILFGVPSAKDGEFLWSQDTDGKIRIEFAVSDRWHKQLFFQPLGPKRKK